MINGSSAVDLHNRTSRHMVYAANYYNGYISDVSFIGPAPPARITIPILHGRPPPARIPLPIQPINPPLAVVHPFLISKPMTYHKTVRIKCNFYLLGVTSIFLD